MKERESKTLSEVTEQLRRSRENTEREDKLKKCEAQLKADRSKLEDDKQAPDEKVTADNDKIEIERDKINSEKVEYTQQAGGLLMLLKNLDSPFVKDGKMQKDMGIIKQIMEDNTVAFDNGKRLGVGDFMIKMVRHASRVSVDAIKEVENTRKPNVPKRKQQQKEGPKLEIWD